MEAKAESTDNPQTTIDYGIEVQEDKSDPGWWYFIVACVLLIAGACAYPIILRLGKGKEEDDNSDDNDDEKVMRTQRVTSMSETGETEQFMNGSEHEGDSKV